MACPIDNHNCSRRASRARRHETQIHTPSHPRQTPQQIPRLHRLQNGKINKTHQRPQSGTGGHQRPKLELSKIPRLFQARAAEPSHDHDECDGVGRAARALVNEELQHGVAAIEAWLYDRVIGLLGVELLVIVGGCGGDGGRGGVKGAAWEEGFEELLPEEVGGAIEGGVENEVQDGRPGYSVG